MSIRKTDADIRREEIAQEINRQLCGTGVEVIGGGRQGPYALIVSRLNEKVARRLIKVIRIWKVREQGGMNEREFLARTDFHGKTLSEAIDGLKAHDHGAHDSGINDPELRSAVVAYLRSLSPEERRRARLVVARQYLTDEAIAAGYGMQDVRDALDWIDWEVATGDAQ